MDMVFAASHLERDCISAVPIVKSLASARLLGITLFEIEHGFKNFILLSST